MEMRMNDGSTKIIDEGFLFENTGAFFFLFFACSKIPKPYLTKTNTKNNRERRAWPRESPRICEWL